MEKENAINFLLYSYFGITLTSKADEVLCAAIDRAYRDASSHVLSIKNENTKLNKKMETAGKIKIKLCELGKGDKLYDTWHGELCGELCKTIYKDVEFGENREFTYGIAQKWVNMTMKHLYLLNAIFGEKSDFFKKHGWIVAKYSSDLHAPIDSYIISAAKAEGVEPHILESDNDRWSKIREGKPYQKYQDELKKKTDKAVIEWEGPAWITQSQLIKEKNKEDLKHRYPDFFKNEG